MKPQRLSYGSDRLIRGRILTRVLNPDVKDISPKMRAFLGSRAIAELDPAFKAFQCKKCGRVDELACFKQGIVSKLVVPKPRPDLHVTEEYFYLWSRRFADLMLKLAGDAVYLFELPADAGYVVPWPKQLIEAPDVPKLFDEFAIPHGVAFRPYLPRCEQCGRYGGMTFWSEFFTPPPDVRVAAVSVEVEHRPKLFRQLSWIVSGQIAEEIKKASLTNVRVKDAFASEEATPAASQAEDASVTTKKAAPARRAKKQK